MIAGAAARKTIGPWLLLMMSLTIAGCGIGSAYRPAPTQTIRDAFGPSNYRHQVGVLVLSDITSNPNLQAGAPLSTGFWTGMQSAVSNAALVAADHRQAPSFLSRPPRLANGDVDGFALAAMARQAGINKVVSPVLLNIRVQTRDKGWGFFKDGVHSVEIQGAASIYDAITGSRSAFEMLTETVRIDPFEADILRSGKPIRVETLDGVAAALGQRLGRRVGAAINAGQWMGSVTAVEPDGAVMAFGSAAGIAEGDRFSVLDGSKVLLGVDGRRYIVPGPKIGAMTITRTAPHHALGVSDEGLIPPVGSILIPD